MLARITYNILSLDEPTQTLNKLNSEKAKAIHSLHELTVSSKQGPEPEQDTDEMELFSVVPVSKRLRKEIDFCRHIVSAIRIYFELFQQDDLKRYESDNLYQKGYISGELAENNAEYLDEFIHLLALLRSYMLNTHRGHFRADLAYNQLVVYR